MPFVDVTTAKKLTYRQRKSKSSSYLQEFTEMYKLGICNICGVLGTGLFAVSRSALIVFKFLSSDDHGQSVEQSCMMQNTVLKCSLACD